jgi:hypothetical protein
MKGSDLSSLIVSAKFRGPSSHQRVLAHEKSKGTHNNYLMNIHNSQGMSQLSQVNSARRPRI